MKILVTGDDGPLRQRVLMGLRGRHDARVLEEDAVVPDRWGPAMADTEVLVHLVERCQAPDGVIVDRVLKASQSVLHAMSAYAQPKRAIVLSTALLDHPSPDEPDVSPDRYGSAWLAARCAVEARVNRWARKTGVETCIVRAGHPFGAAGIDGPLTGWLEAAAASAEGSGRFTVEGANARLPFVHVDELARSIVARVDGEPMPGEAQLIPSISRVEAVDLLASLGEIHARLCGRTERTPRLAEPRTFLGRAVAETLRGQQRAPVFLRRAPRRAVNAEWVARFGPRRLDELIDALVGGAC